MSLILALKNRESLVLASDSAATADRFGQMMILGQKVALLMCGNLEAIRHAVMETALPQLAPGAGPATAAQLIQAALVLEVVPKLAQISGRIELIVAGIDPVRHVEEPNLYYLDSAQDFYLTMVGSDAVAAGATAALGQILVNQNFGGHTTAEMQALAKEAYASTRLRWPAAIGQHLRMVLITPDGIHEQTGV